MTTVADSSDDEINPVTMLLLNQNDDLSEQKPEAVPTLVQHQTYHLNSVNSTVVIRQLPSQGLSFQLWPAATTFVKLLDSYNPSNTDSFSAAVTNAVTTVNCRKRLRILELGSGTGVVGIAASAILGADVTVTDLPHVLPNIKFNADVNASVVGPRGGGVHVAALSWGKVEEMEAVGREYDLIIGSDVVYHDNLYEPLIETLKFLLLGDGEKVFLMAHLRRWKKESGFFKKVKKWFRVDLVHEDGPSDGSRTGVVVYRFARKDAVFR
ncbi:putative lysine methyltransferase, S-adenosyl-L-methionine-dependent methyltransferase [Helianthus annuus]|uniref:Lysine methyltransferase, S-adenosyl-L-methionine-dependent methyltransferase n=1 Tax=Helianthus annuus TaxID=4232 RepID=A0A251TY85_HELAN|nr:protein N-lysine methyltransferase METTL21A [Helianthus annuus]KAF5791363.1 putative lysine methyltransferase, S-adenosyl-L-methionine-dependent methyltransferase [Helianthus annuus]KAJ0542830.1 putative lysine methyltransferase, S-adenosyl-L-methionine-dependent methyltransferase [Helianthus annuus]